MNNIHITKTNGETEVFDRGKLAHSLTHAGVTDDIREKVIAHIENELTPGMRTSDIYRHAFEVLKKSKQHKAALNYSIRRAVLDLGPSGFPFEELISELYRRKGYTISTDTYVKGHCAEHEIDVIAYKNTELIMIEAKFHNADGVKSDLKVALYVKARFEDLFAATFAYGEATKLTRGILITNTKFTHTAIEYAKCAGLSLIGWNYPDIGNLQDMIQEFELHPVTCLNNLSKKDKDHLLERNIVFLKSLKENISVLNNMGMDTEKQKKVMLEINSIV